MNDVYIGLGLAVLGAAVVLYFMHKHQKRRERDADHQFELTMKSHGLSTEIIEQPKHEMMHAEVAMQEQEIEVRDENFDLEDLGKVKRKKAPSKKKKTSKKKAKKATKRK